MRFNPGILLSAIPRVSFKKTLENDQKVGPVGSPKPNCGSMMHGASLRMIGMMNMT